MAHYKRYVVMILGCIFCVGSVVHALGLGEDWERLASWIESNGGSVARNQITLEEIEGFGKGIIALEDMNEGFEFSKVPMKSLFTTEFIRTNSRLNTNGKLETVRPVEIFVLFLIDQILYEKNQSWQPYFNTIPTMRPNTSPLFYSNDMIKKLSHSVPQVAKEIGLYVNAVKDSFHMFQADFQNELPNLTLEDVKWAVSTVQSRLFGIGQINRESQQWEKSNALVPLADLINTNYPPSKLNADCLTDTTSEFFICSTTQHIKAGQQIFVPYVGAMDQNNPINKHLLMTYGFVLDTNADPSSEDGRLLSALRNGFLDANRSTCLKIDDTN